MGVLEEILKDKEELILRVLDLLEGREAKTTINLNGVKFKFGNSRVELGGKIEIGFVPYEKKGKGAGKRKK